MSEAGGSRINEKFGAHYDPTGFRSGKGAWGTIENVLSQPDTDSHPSRHSVLDRIAIALERIAVALEKHE